jgi:hypothetical protein
MASRPPEDDQKILAISLLGFPIDINFRLAGNHSRKSAREFFLWKSAEATQGLPYGYIEVRNFIAAT